MPSYAHDDEESEPLKAVTAGSPQLPSVSQRSDGESSAPRVVSWTSVAPWRLITAIALVSLAFILGYAFRGVEQSLGPSQPGAFGGLRPEPFHCPLFSERWAVLTTSSAPTAAVRSLAQQPGWKVLVVGDTAAPSDWVEQLGSEHQDSVFFLSVEAQRKLPYRIVKLTSTQSYARKNLGYLVAIQCGGTVIFDTDDNVEPTNTIRVLPVPASVADVPLVANRSEAAPAVNVYAYFGRRDLWPRGLPLEMLSETTETPYDAQIPAGALLPYVQQHVPDTGFDVDAIVHLTKPETAGVRLDKTSRTVALAPGTFSPYNSHHTIHRLPAFWGLLLPVSSAASPDILRSYWVQRILWDIGGVVTFGIGGATVNVQARGAHSFLEDFKREAQQCTHAGELVRHLVAWNSTALTVFERIQELVAAMVRWRVGWGEEDAQLVSAWLVDLISIGYAPPAVLPAKSIAGDPLIPVAKDAPAAAGATAVCVTGLADRITSFNVTLHRLLHAARWIPAALGGVGKPERVDIFALVGTMRSSEDDLDVVRSLPTTRTLLYRDRDLGDAGLPAGIRVEMKPGWKPFMLWQQLWAESECFDMAERYAHEHSLHYHTFLRVRTDSVLDSMDLPSAMAFLRNTSRIVVVPSEHNYHGANDRIAMGDLEGMRVYMRRYHNLTNPVLWWTDEGPVLHAETHLGQVLEANGITVQRLPIIYWQEQEQKLHRYRGDHESLRV